MNIVGHCRVCGVPMISEYAWKKKLRPRGIAPHIGKGLCGKHWSRAKRLGDPAAPTPAPWNARPERAEDVPEQHCQECGHLVAHRRTLARFPALREKGWVVLAGQGLCSTCYRRAWEKGTLERINRTADDVLDEWVWLRDDGYADVRIAAKRMGMTYAALDKALWRARKRGDQRGSLVPFAHDMRRRAA